MTKKLLEGEDKMGKGLIHNGTHKDCKKCEVLNLFIEVHGEGLGLADAKR